MVKALTEDSRAQEKGGTVLVHLSWSWGFEVDPGGGEGYLLAWGRVIKRVDSSGGKASAAGLGLGRSFQA